MQAGSQLWRPLMAVLMFCSARTFEDLKPCGSRRKVSSSFGILRVQLRRLYNPHVHRGPINVAKIAAEAQQNKRSFSGAAACHNMLTETARGQHLPIKSAAIPPTYLALSNWVRINRDIFFEILD